VVEPTLIDSWTLHTNVVGFGVQELVLGVGMTLVPKGTPLDAMVTCSTKGVREVTVTVVIAFPPGRAAPLEGLIEIVKSNGARRVSVNVALPASPSAPVPVTVTV